MVPRDSIRSIVTWFCSVSPLMLLSTLLAMAIHIRLYLGRWPQFGEEPGTIIFRSHEVALIAVVWFAVYCAGPLWLVLICFRPFRLPWTTHLLQLAVFCLGWLTVGIAGRFDPTPFTSWLLD